MAFKCFKWKHKNSRFYISVTRVMVYGFNLWARQYSGNKMSWREFRERFPHKCPFRTNSMLIFNYLIMWNIGPQYHHYKRKQIIFGKTITMKTIEIFRRTNDYIAFVKGYPEYWGNGKSMDAAVGSLIRSHGGDLYNLSWSFPRRR